MSFEDRNNLVIILMNLVIAAYFGLWIVPGVLTGAYDGAAGLVAWAQATLMVISVSIVGTIVLTILFAIGYAIVTHNTKPSEIVDERDRAIGNFGLRVNLYVAGAGFLVSLVGLAFWSWPALWALNLGFFGFMLGGLAGGVAKFILYRRG